MTAEILSNPLSSLFRLESSEFCALGPLPGQKEEQREGESQTLCPGNGAYVALEGALLRSFILHISGAIVSYSLLQFMIGCPGGPLLD